MFYLSAKSSSRLHGVHPDLAAVVRKAICLTTVDFAVIEGVRSKQRQYELLALGKTQTIKSRHLTGHAVDLAAIIDGAVSWDWSYYRDIAEAMFAAAHELCVNIEWGGNWKTFKDGPHFQLTHADYPEE